ncbi:ABC transporter substrate-binding protein [Pacificibacter marinus]|uniref:Bacterial extracellular solute-binding protein n=1 Tax=Pacificibacter marinus TaxID=658057 RepID=A0A1Y5SVC9_9RHOB|nr:ABC transporter substrate-binding protein [Pacificibacter marinus]SEK84037.1 maltose-binding protein/trehalose-binding protein/sucrose-binding protein [Pacificibacter marinus]SLN48880.1 Bacterial extracellular solute-binding protein [Pacificibacter marinus]
MKKTLLTGAAMAALFAGAASAQDLSGETITVAGAWLSPESEVIESVFDIFEERTGATVKYVGSDSFEQQIRIDAEAGSAPNLAIFPQPGLAADLAALGFLTPLQDGSADWIKENYAAGQSWVDLGTFADKDGVDQLFGMFFRVDLKSLVWYSPENFEDAGYEVPTSMEELKTLSDQIVADGDTPWCIGLGSGAATGWPATDWVEDMLLRTQSPDVYDGWVSNEISFDDPRIVAAIEEFGAFALKDDYVAGGAGAVASTDFRDSPKGLFASPPQCYMHKQASFIPAFFPEGTVVGEDADFFYFPAYEGKDLGKPVLGAGTVVTITNPSKGAQSLVEFLRDPAAHEVWMEAGGFLTPHKGVDTSKFSTDTARAMNDILLNATTFRFDGSDLMPGGVGAGSFWTGMVDYAGGKDVTEVATEIQSSWDALK